jgi:hypothetical protein
MPTEAGTAPFQEAPGGRGPGNLGGVLVIRSQLTSEIPEALRRRGEPSLSLAAAVGAVLLCIQKARGSSPLSSTGHL